MGFVTPSETRYDDSNYAALIERASCGYSGYPAYIIWNDERVIITSPSSGKVAAGNYVYSWNSGDRRDQKIVPCYHLNPPVPNVWGQYPVTRAPR